MGYLRPSVQDCAGTHVCVTHWLFEYCRFLARSGESYFETTAKSHLNIVGLTSSRHTGTSQCTWEQLHLLNDFVWCSLSEVLEHSLWLFLTLERAAVDAALCPLTEAHLSLLSYGSPVLHKFSKTFSLTEDFSFLNSLNIVNT